MNIYLASGSSKKLEEVKRILKRTGLVINVHSANELGGMPDVVEDGETFEDNARLKVEALEELVPEDAWILGDDSGLCVDALEGEPGVRSARYAGEGATDVQNNEKLLRELADKEDRSAHFYCALVLRQRAGVELVFAGLRRGKILKEPQGDSGFGYDPLFVPKGLRETYAQMNSIQKDKESHRGAALSQLVEYLEGRD